MIGILLKRYVLFHSDFNFSTPFIEVDQKTQHNVTGIFHSQCFSLSRDSASVIGLHLKRLAVFCFLLVTRYFQVATLYSVCVCYSFLFAQCFLLVRFL